MACFRPVKSTCLTILCDIIFVALYIDDQTRVTLEGKGDSDYINATMIEVLVDFSIVIQNMVWKLSPLYFSIMKELFNSSVWV